MTKRERNFVYRKMLEKFNDEEESLVTLAKGAHNITELPEIRIEPTDGDWRCYQIEELYLLRVMALIEAIKQTN